MALTSLIMVILFKYILMISNNIICQASPPQSDASTSLNFSFAAQPRRNIYHLLVKSFLIYTYTHKYIYIFKIIRTQSIGLLIYINVITAEPSLAFTCSFCSQGNKLDLTVLATAISRVEDFSPLQIKAKLCALNTLSTCNKMGIFKMIQSQIICCCKRQARVSHWPL